MKKKPQTMQPKASEISTEKQKLRRKQSINYWIHALEGSLAKGATSYYGRLFGVTLPEMRILSTLDSHGDLTARDLVTSTAMDKGMISRVLTGLGSKGFVELMEDEKKRRLRQWTLTKSGLAFIAELRPEWKRREAIIQAGLTKPEYNQLLGLLERLFYASEDLRIEENAALKAESN